LRCLRPERAAEVEFSEARSLFETLARSHGLGVFCGDQVALLENGLVRLTNTGAGVRLEIAHGPLNGSATGWLELYSEAAASQKPGLEEPDLADSIAYALELAI